MRRLWKYRKKILYNEYEPKSQLIVGETRIERSRYSLIDGHAHFGGRIPGDPFEDRYDIGNTVEQLKIRGVKKCVELTLFNRENWERVHEKLQGYEDYFVFCAPIDLSGMGRPDFDCWICGEMERYVREGAAGFKVWKDLGLRLRDEDGKRIPINSPRLKAVWDKAAELDKPVVIHVADPPAFFEPADRYNERLEEIVQYHFWHHYGKGLEFKSFMEQLDDLLEKNPGTDFLAAHLCSYPGNLDYVSDLLTRHENLYTDVAAVLSEIGRQPRRFRRFVQEHPGRILFGTDFFAGDPLPYIPYFRFLETEDEYFSYSPSGGYEHGRWRIYGCGLEDELLKNLYYRNAEKFFGINGEEE